MKQRIKLLIELDTEIITANNLIKSLEKIGCKVCIDGILTILDGFLIPDDFAFGDEL